MNSTVELQNIKNIEKRHNFEISHIKETIDKRTTIRIKADFLAQEKTENLRILLSKL